MYVSAVSDGLQHSCGPLWLSAPTQAESARHPSRNSRRGQIRCNEMVLLHSHFRHSNARRIQRSSYLPSSLKSLSSRGGWDQLRMRDNRASRDGDGHMHRIDHKSPRWPLTDIVTKPTQPPLPFPLSPRRSLCPRRSLRSSKVGTETKRSNVPVKNSLHIASFVHSLHA